MPTAELHVSAAVIHVSAARPQQTRMSYSIHHVQVVFLKTEKPALHAQMRNSTAGPNRGPNTYHGRTSEEDLSQLEAFLQNNVSKHLSLACKGAQDPSYSLQLTPANMWAYHGWALTLYHTVAILFNVHPGS